MKRIFFVFIAVTQFLVASEENTDMASNSNMYKTYSSYYDYFYQSKDYEKECTFIQTLLSEYQTQTILDVGCGTGTHLSKLEQYGYTCEGIDFNLEMVEIANKKLKGKVFQGDMRNYKLNKKYDAITSLFAVFNHNLNLDDARKTLAQLKSHLKQDGVLILDLYNPQSSGEKTNFYKGITKIMKWNFNSDSQICESIVTFFDKDKKLCEEKFPLRIYSISEMRKLLEEAGFIKIQVYNNYTFEEATQCSKNLVFVAQ